jgi:hypothetical protein
MLAAMSRGYSRDVLAVAGAHGRRQKVRPIMALFA